MIFVTVGTHEQQFNRLIQQIDNLKESGEIIEDVFIQTGYCTYAPKYCKWSKFLPYKDMKKYVLNARIVITHGGPSSFILPLQINKVPIVVPREERFGEHINNHQVEFVSAVHKRFGNIIPVFELEQLGRVIKSYDRIVAEMPHEMHRNNENFNKKLGIIVENIFQNKRS